MTTMLTAMLTIPACQFDQRSAGVDVDDQPDAGPRPSVPDAGEPADLGGPDAALPSAYVATTEDTRRGEILDGSFLDSHDLDQRYEIIRAELSRNDERLEHKWFIDPIPAGLYEVTMVGVAVARDNAAFLVEYKPDGGKHEPLFSIPGNGALAEHAATITLLTDTQLELRVKLDLTASDLDVATSSLALDYLVLTPIPATIAP